MRVSVRVSVRVRVRVRVRVSVKEMPRRGNILVKKRPAKSSLSYETNFFDKKTAHCQVGS